MGLGKQSKTLNKSQIQMVSNHLRNGRNGLRNQTIFLLSVKSGLRAKEISQLSWKEVCNSDGQVDTQINLSNQTSKGNSGRVIPLHKSVRENLIELLERHHKCRSFNLNSSFVIRTERSPFHNIANDHQHVPEVVSYFRSDWMFITQRSTDFHHRNI